MYDNYDEASRLETGLGRLEFVRTCAIVERHLPPPPAVVYDIGGGPGNYLRWLLGRGYEVHLLDPVPAHIAQARGVLAAHSGPGRGSARRGNAVTLPYGDGSGAVALLMGPLYHLTARADRLRALAEARRVLQPGGLLVAAAISRFADLFYALDARLLGDEQFTEIVAHTLESGQHHNPDRLHSSFTHGFYHRPDQLAEEVSTAGFAEVQLVAVEGPAWVSRQLTEDLQDKIFWKRLLRFLQAVEGEPALLGASPHFLTVARAPG